MTDTTFAVDSEVVSAMPRDHGIEVLAKAAHSWGKDGEYAHVFFTEADLCLMLLVIKDGQQ